MGRPNQTVVVHKHQALGWVLAQVDLVAQVSDSVMDKPNPMEDLHKHPELALD